jgi:hypothetical protein
MSIRKIRRAGRGLLWIVGTPDCGTACQDCRDHLARVQTHRRSHRDGHVLPADVPPSAAPVRDVRDGVR